MKDINESELQAFAGGAVPWIIPLLAGAVIGSIVNGWSDFKEGYAEAFARETAGK